MQIPSFFPSLHRSSLSLKTSLSYKQCQTLASKNANCNPFRHLRNMSKQVVTTNNAPAALGPYSQGIKASGNFLFVSGQLGLDKAGNLGSDVEAQTQQALENMGAILTAGGSSFAKVVKTTILLKDINDFAKVNAVYGKFFPSDPPARATYQVAALPKGGLVEIEAVALAD